MVPNLIWAPDFFGPREIWSPRSLVPKKFGPRMKIITWLFLAGPKLLWAQISQGPNEIGDHFSYIDIKDVALVVGIEFRKCMS